MKKFLIIASIAMFILVSCGSGNNDTADSGDTSSQNDPAEDATDSGEKTDTNNEENTDTADTGDSTNPDPADTGDTGGSGECRPNCGDGQECGSDGCGGVCGVCGEGTACGEGFKCLPSTCSKLTFDEVYLDYGSYFAYAAGNAAGDNSIPDMLQIDFWDSEGYAVDELKVGVYQLTDPSTCETCMTFYEDIDDSLYAAKLYAQESGILNITEVKEGTVESKGNASFKLIEVNEYYEPVKGGKCYDVENLTWDTICIPHCEKNQVCGDDGCGGVCGKCSKDQGCSADKTQCVPLDLSGCTGISIDFGTLKQYYSNSFYTDNSEYNPYVYMVFYLGDDETEIKAGTYDLGSEKNSYFETCTECLRLYSDYDNELTDYAKTFFQHGGTLTVSSVTGNNKIKGTVSATLVEAEITDDRTSTFVAGGKCLEIETSAFDVPAE